MRIRCRQIGGGYADIMGTREEYCDLLLQNTYRVVTAENIDTFDKAALRGFVTADRRIPDAALACSVSDGFIKTKHYCDFSNTPYSWLLGYAAAAYGLYRKRIIGGDEYFILDGAAGCKADAISVTVKTKMFF